MTRPLVLLTLAMAGLIAGVVAWTSASADSTPHPPNVAGITIPPRPWGDVAFASNRPDGDPGSDYDIYTIYAEGADIQQRTNEPGDDLWPQWSPDGMAIAFTSDRDGNEEIYTMHPSGADQTNVSNNPATDRHPTWSPDGTKIAFASDRTGDWEIYVMDLGADAGAQQSGDNVTNITNSPETDDEFPDWSRTGEQLSFIRDGDIWLMNNDGSNAIEIHDPPTDVVGAANWKPDLLAVLYSREDDPHVWMVWVDGTHLIPLVEGKDGDWGPTGYRIVFAYDDEIQSADMMGGEQAVLMSNDADDIQPNWNWAEFMPPNTHTPTPFGTPAYTATPTNTPAPATNTPPPPTNTPTPVTLPGDVDCGGSVNAIDAALVLQFTGALLNSLPCPQNADVNDDGQTNAVDAALILQYVAGLLDDLPP